VDDQRYELALTEARRGIDGQREDLAGVRDRASGLLAVAGLSAAFIGGLSIRDGADLSNWTIVAAVAFTGLVVVASFVLWPRKFTFALNAEILVAWANQEAATTSEMDRRLAEHLTNHYDKNEKAVRWLFRAYTAGIVLLAVEIAALLIDLRGR